MHQEGMVGAETEGAICLLAARDVEDLGRLGLAVIAEVVRQRPAAAISLTTGRTTSGLYRALSATCQRGAIDLSAARFVSSEEYLGVSADSPISLFGWLQQSVLAPCLLPLSSTLRLAGDAPDPAAECLRFDREIERMGGLDLVVQSVGANGHFGFNEPGSARDAPSRVVTLTPMTRESNGSYWPDDIEVPSYALTMGVRTTLQARHVLLLASGVSKAGALQRTLYGPIDELVPCSLLRLASRLTVIADGSTLPRGMANGDQAPPWLVASQDHSDEPRAADADHSRPPQR